MAITLTKQRCYTPEHLIDEESTIPKTTEVASAAVAQTANVENHSLGILEKKQTIIKNIDEIREKVKQARVFTVKKDIKPLYRNEFLEAGHKIVFLKPYYDNYNLGSHNLSLVNLQVKTLLLSFYDNSSMEIELELKDFDTYFEPDYALSKLYSANPIMRILHSRELKAHLQSAREQVIRKGSK